MEGRALIAEALLAGSKGTEILSGLGDGLAVEANGDTAEFFIAVGDIEVDLMLLAHRYRTRGSLYRVVGSCGAIMLSCAYSIDMHGAFCSIQHSRHTESRSAHTLWVILGPLEASADWAKKTKVTERIRSAETRSL